ncbi:protease, partial [Streptomyces sp. NPDC004658]
MNEGNRVPPVDGPEEAAGMTPSDRTGAAGAAVPEATGSDGDFELASPARLPAAADGGETHAGGAEGDPGAGTGADTGTDSGRGVPGSSGTTGETSWAAPAERPRPLHDPDPYGTPPYGEPGPWAPAPPVQHPAATPAHGTAVPAAASPVPAPGPVTRPPAAAPTAP